MIPVLSIRATEVESGRTPKRSVSALDEASWGWGEENPTRGPSAFLTSQLSSNWLAGLQTDRTAELYTSAVRQHW